LLTRLRRCPFLGPCSLLTLTLMMSSSVGSLFLPGRVRVFSSPSKKEKSSRWTPSRGKCSPSQKVFPALPRRCSPRRNPSFLFRTLRFFPHWVRPHAGGVFFFLYSRITQIVFLLRSFVCESKLAVGFFNRDAVRSAPIFRTLMLSLPYFLFWICSFLGLHRGVFVRNLWIPFQGTLLFRSSLSVV